MKAKFISRLVVASAISLAGQASAATFTSTADPGANDCSTHPLTTAAAIAFEAASNETVIDFESVALNAVPLASFLISPGVRVTGALASIRDIPISNAACSPVNGLFGFDTTKNFPGLNSNPAASHFLGMLGGTLLFEFDVPVDGFGAFITGVQIGNETITTFNGANPLATYVIPNPGSGVIWAAFMNGPGDLPVTSLLFNAQFGTDGDVVGFDDIHILSAVPEPSSIALLCLGLTAIGVRRRKTARAAVAHLPSPGA